MEHSNLISLLDEMDYSDLLSPVNIREYLYHKKTQLYDDHSYKNISRLVANPDLVSRMQDLKLDGREKVVSFRWLGPHFLAFLKHAAKLSSYTDETGYPLYREFNNLLKRLDDSASDCILYEETKHYKIFLEITVSFILVIKELFTIQKQYSDSGRTISDDVMEAATFLDFLLETIGELLSCRTYSSVPVSNQVKVLWKSLKFLLSFLVDTLRCIKIEQTKVEFAGFEDHLSKQKQIENIFKGNILTEIEDVSNEAGLFLHSFFFTTDLTKIATKMYLTISILLDRIENVKVEIEDYCIAVSMKLNCGNRSLQVAESPSEVSSSHDISIPMVEEKIVGYEDMTTQIASKLLQGPEYRWIVSILGMPGLGKTTLAKKLYNDSNVRNHFDKISWCVISQTYKKKKVLIDILSSISDLNRDKMFEMEDGKLAEHLYRTLIGTRYLIVMDDLWDIHAWVDLKRFFPNDNINGSRVLFTSRQKKVALEISHVIIEPPPLSPEESWNLLEQKVFKKERCPQELQDIGKKIAKNCHGLPLSIITIAGVLSNMEKKESLWQQVAKSLSSYIFQKSNDYIPTLKVSYMHLPNHLKPCFLYLSAFQEDDEIPVRKLLLLWIAEGFIEKKEHKSLEDVAEDYLMDLIDRSLVQVYKRRSDNGVKSCTLHDLVLDMCWKIAEEEKFLFQHQFLISKHRHRLCMNWSHHLSKALSILFNSEKTRILDAGYDEIDLQRIKFYVPNLRYLEISSLTSSIGRFHNLEFLLVKDTDFCIPTYLLNMPKMRHIHAGIKDGFAKFEENFDSSQPNSLQTLCYICVYNSKDEEILRCSPNLFRLKCESPNNRFPDLNFLSQLEALTVVFKSRFKGDYSTINFPRNIKNLTLSKIGLPWKEMSLIGIMPNLEILKLEWNSFVGKIWETNDDEFQKLKFLKLDRLYLEQWNSLYNHFPVLERLVLRICNKLEMIPFEFRYIPTLQKIEVYICGKGVKSSAQEIGEEQKDNGNEEFEVTIDSLWV